MARRTKKISAEDQARAERMAAARAATEAVVAKGSCPTCGSKVRRNTSLSGWWQCEQYGAPGFRARAADPPCNWQGFTSALRQLDAEREKRAARFAEIVAEAQRRGACVQCATTDPYRAPRFIRHRKACPRGAAR